MRGKTAPRAAGAIQHRQPRQMDAQTAEAPNIRCFRCLPKISRNRKVYRLRFCALHPDTERGRSSADGAIRRDRAGKVCLIFHRTGGETMDEAPLRKHEDHRDRDGRNDGGRHHVTPSSSTPRRGTSSQERRPASSNRAGRSRTVPELCAETLKISVRGSLKCWSEIQFDKKKILYHAARPVMVGLAGLKAFYGRFLDKNGVCW